MITKEKLIEKLTVIFKQDGKSVVESILKGFNAKNVSAVPVSEYENLMNVIRKYSEKHSILSPSRAHRWSKCAGSVKTEQAYVNTSSEAAQIGTNAHEMADYCLKNNKDTKDYVSEEFTVTSQMRYAVQQYLDYCRSLISQYPKALWYSEAKIGIEAIYSGMYGTCDFFLMDEESGRIFVVDYKNGAGVVVNIKDNKQLICYGIGAAYKKLKFRPKYKSVTTVIVQPNTGGETIKTQTYTKAQLEKHRKELNKAAKIAMSEDNTLVAGKHCKWCDHAMSCSVYRQAAKDIIQFNDDGNVIAVDTLSDDELGKLYFQATDILSDWIKAIYGETFRRLEKGKAIPDLYIVPKRANRSWVDAAEPILVDLYGEGAFKLVEKELKSPAQIEQLLGKKDFAETLSDYTQKKSSGFKIGTDKEKAISVESRSAKTAFGVIKS